MTDREAMRLALENICGAKLCEINSMSSRKEMLRLMDEAIAVLRQALEKHILADSIRPKGKSITKVWVDEINQTLAQPEPSMGLIPSEWVGLEKSDIPIDRGAWDDVPDATKWLDELRGDDEQPEREWQGLTDEEITEGAKQSWVDRQAFESAVWWAEEKLREKNGF